MLGYVAVTDIDWFEYLRAQPQLSEINFWQPGGGKAFKAIAPGEPFFFKLKKPNYKIGGFGIFARHSLLPVWMAWDCFGTANGAPTLERFRSLIARYKKLTNPIEAMNATIGCIMVSEPIFFQDEDWFPEPADFAHSLPEGRTYGLRTGEGLRVWEECRARVGLAQAPGLVAAADSVAAAGELGGPRYGQPYVVTPRLGQGTFRVAVTDVYGRACAVTNEHSLPAVDAAHIKPYADGGPRRTSNGIALRADIHRLFDQGYVTVTPAGRFEVSRRLKEDYNNGRVYYPFHGQTTQRAETHGRSCRPVLQGPNHSLAMGAGVFRSWKPPSPLRGYDARRIDPRSSSRATRSERHAQCECPDGGH